MNYYRTNIDYKEQSTIWKIIGRLPAFIHKFLFRRGMKFIFTAEKQGDWDGFSVNIQCPFRPSDKELQALIDPVIAHKIEKHSKGERYCVYGQAERNNYLASVFLLKEMLEEIRVTKHIARKNMNIVLIDGNTALSDFVIADIYDELNYFTIVTERREYFEAKTEEIFEETGLAAVILDYPVTSVIAGNIILDLRTENGFQVALFNKGSIYISLYRMDFHILSHLEVIDQLLVLKMFEMEYGLVNEPLTVHNILTYKKQMDAFKKRHNLEIIPYVSAL